MHFICYLLRLLLFPPIYSTNKFIGADWIIADIAYRLPTTVQQQQSSPFPPTDKYLSIETLFRSACTYCQSTPMVTNEPNPPSTTTKNNNRRKKRKDSFPTFCIVISRTITQFRELYSIEGCYFILGCCCREVFFLWWHQIWSHHYYLERDKQLAYCCPLQNVLAAFASSLIWIVLPPSSP